MGTREHRPGGSAFEPRRVAHLPSADEAMDTQEAERIVAAFEAARRRAHGRHAAPESWLPASGRRVASALEMLYDQAAAGDWPAIRRIREAFVDLQAFVPDDEAASAQMAAGRRRHGGGGPRDLAVLDRIRWAQAVAISAIRRDDRVVGAHNALVGVDIVIGGARRSLGAVARYKESQALGIASLMVWPASLVLGLLVGTLVTGFSIVAMVAVVLLAIGGWVLALGPAWGWGVGSLGSRLDRLAMRPSHDGLVLAGRSLATALEVALLAGGPAAIALGLVLACRSLGMP